MNILKKILSLLIISIIFVSLFGCSNTNKENYSSDSIEQEESNHTKGKVYKIRNTKTEDGGITQTIEEVSVFNNMEDASNIYKDLRNFSNDENKEKITVVIKFKIENNNNFPISAYVSVRPFVVNTGEKGDYIQSETYDAKIGPGETNEGYTAFNLTKTTIDELQSINMWWIVAHNYGQPDDSNIFNETYAKDNKFDIVLK